MSWPMPSISSSSLPGTDVDVHLLRMTIRNLRLKLDAVAPGASYIATEYGLGYRLTGPASPADVTS